MLERIRASTRRNYLRVRGEYYSRFKEFPQGMELPPRARRIQGKWDPGAGDGGTTSACAENTFVEMGGQRGNGNYLRVRGEYFGLDPEIAFLTELPPRARRIHHHINHITRGNGTTSACAENTERQLDAIAPWRNYLRVRGEYRTAAGCYRPLAELPPRARRIPYMKSKYGVDLGTTSACAENTPSSPPVLNDIWNYLRVRGEYQTCGGAGFDSGELPPRARRIRKLQ